MAERDVLKNHRELARQSAGAILALADIAERRSSMTTHRGERVPREQVLRDCAQRLLETRFALAVVGEFSRGKSTLINALLGQGDLLPTAIEPSTATITVISYGEETSATVHFRDGREPVQIAMAQLKDHVTSQDLDGSELESKLAARVTEFRDEEDLDKLSYEEIESQGSAQALAISSAAIDKVEIRCPSPFLQDGIVVVDTPGIGSVYPQHGEATRRFVHLADAVMFLINTDPVIGASECNFLQFLQDHVNRFLFVVTKIDRFDEQEQEASLNYTRRTIERHAEIKAPQVFPVSARLFTEGTWTQDPAKVAASGFAKFLEGLDLFLIRSRGQRFVDEQVREALSHLRNLRSSVQMELKGLQMDLTEIRDQVEKTKPILEKAAAAKDDTLADLSQLIANVDQVVLGTGSVDWIRLALTIKEQTLETIRTFDWEELQHAADLVPILVKDLLAVELQPKLDEVTEHVNAVTNRVLADCKAILEEMNREVGFQAEDRGAPEDLDFSVDYDPGEFQAHLRRVGTITIGSTLSLTVGSAIFFGGVGAVVTIGRLLAGKGVTLVFRRRVQEDLCQRLDGPVVELVQSILNSIEEEVKTRLTELRSRVDATMDGAIRDVGETLSRLEEARQRAEFDTADHRRQLGEQEERLQTIEDSLSLIAAPDW